MEQPNNPSLNSDLEAEIKAKLELEAKIKAPVRWAKTEYFIIEDFSENYREEVFRLIRHHYFTEEPMCKSLNLFEDSLSVEEYLNLIDSWLKDQTSMIALSRKSGRVVGIVVGKINEFSQKTDTFERLQEYGSQLLESIMLLQNTLMRETDAYKDLNPKIYLRIYVLCVHPSYKEKNVAGFMLQSYCKLAYYMQVPAVGGIFTSNSDQDDCKNVGFEKMSEIRYNRWLTDGKIVFNNTGIGNSSAVFMRMKILDTTF